MARDFLDAVIKNRTAGVQRIPSKYVKWDECVLQPTSWARKTGNVLTIQLPAAHRGDYTIEPFDEVWIGVYDQTTHHWTNILFGGLIIKPTISAVGAERKYRLELVSYDYELAHVSVPSWPTANLGSPPEEDYYIEGMRPNLPNSVDNPTFEGVEVYDDDPEADVYKAREWIEALESAIPFTDRGGLIPAHSHGFILGDSDAWNTTISNFRMTFDIRPSNSNVLGHLSVMNLQDAIQQVVDAVGFGAVTRGNSPMLPVFWMEAVPLPGDPTQVTARLRVIDLLEPPTVVVHEESEADWWFSDVRPLPAGANKYWGGSIEFDATLYQNYVEVFGHGGELVGYDATTHDPLYAVVYAQASIGGYNLPHSGPTTSAGVQGTAFVIDDVLDRQQAQFMADWLLSLSSQIQVRVTLSTFCDVRPGQMVWIKNSVWPMDGPLRVIEVDNQIRAGNMVRKITCGWPKLDPKTIASGPYARVLQKLFPLATAGGSMLGLVPGTAGFAALNTHPNGRNQNHILSRYDNQGSGNVGPPSSVSNRTSHGQLISDSVFKYYHDLQDPTSTVGGTSPTDPQKAAAQAIPSWMFTDIFGIPSDWYNPQDGTNHPVHLLYEFIDDEWQSPLMPDGATFVETRLTEIDADRNIVTGVLDRVTVAMELARPGTTKVVVSDIPSREHPLTVQYGDVLHIQITGIPADHKVVMFLSERLPLIEGRTELPTYDRYSVSP